MLKFQLATPEDLKVAATIERKRQIEEARKPRIFDPRFRRIGVSFFLCFSSQYFSVILQLKNYAKPRLA